MKSDVSIDTDLIRF